MEAEATAASVRLEGVSVTADEARRILAGDPPADVSGADVEHVLGYREAMALVLSRADDPGFAYQRELIAAIHRAVMSGSYVGEAGRIRRIQNRLRSVLRAVRIGFCGSRAAARPVRILIRRAARAAPVHARRTTVSIGRWPAGSRQPTSAGCWCLQRTGGSRESRSTRCSPGGGREDHPA